MKIDSISDLLYGFIRKDKDAISKAFEVCIANEREGNVRNRLRYAYEEYKRREGMAVLEKLDSSIMQLVTAPYIDRQMDELYLSDEIKQETERFLLERRNADLLIEKGLLPSNKILLEGPPGNGKTSYVSALAKLVGIPLLNTNSSLLLDSYMGKSEQNVSLLFNHLPESCIIFFDEFDALASERLRGDTSAMRAYNSIVTTFLLNLDGLRPSVIFIAATNKSDYLDKALLRRFDIRMEFENPTDEEKKRYVTAYLQRNGLDADMFFKDKIKKKLDKVVSYSALESVMRKQHKELVLDELEMSAAGNKLF